MPDTKELAQTANADETAEGIISDYIRREGVQMENKEGNQAYYSIRTCFTHFINNMTILIQSKVYILINRRRIKESDNVLHCFS